ncbi:copine-8-like isoform X2 [Pecten maximus]|uniref:copine-8-like isoform X2 n=1 Tax=Pecten maximus TaxID=6579 RepID=UPI001457ED7B|nr:copine-8-like isoform X2 [Pecten maximus]
MATFQAGTAVAPSSQVEISVACKNLRDKDAFSKSDPIVVVFTKDVRTNSYYELGRSEMVKNCLNPQFVKKFTMNYFFEESQKLKFEVYDVDSPSQRLDAHDFLGRLECTLGEIVSALGGKLEKPMTGLKGTPGLITIRAEEISTCKESVTMHFCATHLDKKDFLGKSDPFLIFYRANEDKSYTTVHKTEVIKNTLNPTWRPFMITARALCNGDYDRAIKVECYDWDGDGGHDLIGEFTTNLREMTRGGTSGSFQPFTREVINPKKKAKKKNYKNSGQVTLTSCKIEIHPSFLDYVKGGTQLNFTVAIDFTASNGNPSSPTSLHYNSPYQPNQYGSAIQAVGEIIQDYDSDKMFPVLGFGAKLPDGSVSHEFPVNFNSANPYCAGIQGIMQAYYGALQKVQLYGPTNFAPVINHVTRFASSMRDGNNYFVLLILTDGVITDLPNTIEAIVHASGLPLSIIIVGVGNAEFDAMDVLDADDRRLSSRGKQAVRDIVQFVPFRDFMGGKFGNNMQISQAALAKEVLAEIPDQFLQYMKANNIKPKDPKDNVNLPGQGAPPMAPPPGGAPNMPPPPGGAPNMPPPQQGMPNQGSSPYPQAPPPGYPQGGQQIPAPGYPQGGPQIPAPGYPQGGPQRPAAPSRPPPPGSASAPPYPM